MLAEFADACEPLARRDWLVEYEDHLRAVMELAKTVRARQAQLDARTQPVEPEPPKEGEVLFGDAVDAPESPLAEAVRAAAESNEPAVGLEVEEDTSRPDLGAQSVRDLVWTTLARYGACCRDVDVQVDGGMHVTVEIAGVPGAQVPDVAHVSARIKAVYAPMSVSVRYVVLAVG